MWRADRVILLLASFLMISAGIALADNADLSNPRELETGKDAVWVESMNGAEPVVDGLAMDESPGAAPKKKQENAQRKLEKKSRNGPGGTATGDLEAYTGGVSLKAGTSTPFFEYITTAYELDVWIPAKGTICNLSYTLMPFGQGAALGNDKREFDGYRHSVGVGILGVLDRQEHISPYVGAGIGIDYYDLWGVPKETRLTFRSEKETPERGIKTRSDGKEFYYENGYSANLRLGFNFRFDSYNAILVEGQFHGYLLGDLEVEVGSTIFLGYRLLL